jgi:hypothetical protein
MKKEDRQEIARIQSQLNLFRFSARDVIDCDGFERILLQFTRRAHGDFLGIFDAQILQFLISRPFEFWNEAFGHFERLRLYVYVREPGDALAAAGLSMTPLGMMNVQVEVICFKSPGLECCFLFDDDEMMAIQDSGKKKVGFAFPRNWNFVNDYVRLIERFAVTTQPIIHYSNQSNDTGFPFDSTLN